VDLDSFDSERGSFAANIRFQNLLKNNFDLLDFGDSNELDDSGDFGDSGRGSDGDSEFPGFSNTPVDYDSG
jgi:hypothetical protein